MGTALHLEVEFGGYGLRYSADGGITTKQAAGLHGGYSIQNMEITRDGTFYLATICQTGLFVGKVTSIITEVIWKIHQFAGHYTMDIEQIGEKTFVTDNDSLYVTTDGLNFEKVSVYRDKNVHLHSITGAPSDQKVICVGSGHGAWGTSPVQPVLFCNDQDGESGTWTESSPVPTGGPASIIGMAFSPTNSNVLSVATFGHEQHIGNNGTGYGVFTTHDRGKSWMANNVGLNTPMSLWVGGIKKVIRDGVEYTIIVTLDGVYEKKDGEVIWNDISPIQKTDRRFSVIGTDPDNSNVVYVGTVSPNNTTIPANVYYTKDGGKIWKDVPFNMEQFPMDGVIPTWSDHYRFGAITVTHDQIFVCIIGNTCYVANKERI